MAVFFPLPDGMEACQPVQDSLVYLETEPHFRARLALFDKRVLAGLPVMPGVPVLSIAEYNNLIDTVRNTVSWAVRPSLFDEAARPDIQHKIAEMVPPAQSVFTWKWIQSFAPSDMLMPLATDSTVSLAVAILSPSARVGQFKHLLSLSQMWALNPSKWPLAKRLREDAKVWAVCRDARVGEEHLLRSSKSLAKLEQGAALLADPGKLAFTMFMATPLFVLAFFASVVSVTTQSGDLVAWCRAYLGVVFSRFPQKYTCKIGCRPLRVRGGTLSASEVAETLRELGLLEKWRTPLRKGRQGYAFPDVDNPAARVPAADFCFALMRWMDQDDETKRAGVYAIRFFGWLWENCLPQQLLDEPRPSQFDEDNNRLRAKALRGEDKTVLVVNAILARRQGPSLEEEVLIRQVCHWRDFSYARDAGTVSLVSCTMNKALEATTNAISNWKDVVLGVRCSFDDSRVSSKEVMLSNLVVANVFTPGPPQIKPDQPAKLLPGVGYKAFSGIVSGGAGGKSSGGSLIKRAPTLAALFALTNVLLTLLPIGSWSPFLPSHDASPPLGYELLKDVLSGNYYSWAEATRAAAWELPGELFGDVPASVWLFLMVADEGTTGEALFFWLVGQVRMRVLFWRDPSHRISNVFVRSMRKVKGLREHVCDVLLVHKFRRAPYGSGRLLKACKETIALIVTKWAECLPVVEPFRAAIAEDNGVADDLDSVRKVLQDFCKMALGQRVEMRRWFSFIQMGPDLLRIWHILLLALTASALFEGKDPWQMAAAAEARAPTMRGKGKGLDQGKVNDFQFRSEVLRILLSRVTAAVLRSILLVFERTRSHQLHIATAADNGGLTLRHLLFWSHPTRYLQSIVMPSLREALQNAGQLSKIGFSGNVEWTPSEDTIEVEDVDLDEDQEILRLHMLSCIELLAQWFIFSILPQCPPWSYCRALSPSEAEVQESHEHMMAFYSLVRRLENANTKLARDFLSILHFREWPVVREPLTLLARGFEARLRQYVEQLVPKFGHTLFEENTFNSMRDNENRGARHKSRGEHFLSALAQSAIRTRYPNLPHVDITDGDIHHYRNAQVRAETFHPEKVTKKKKTLGIQVESLTGKLTWRSTTFDDLALGGGLLFRALLDTAEERWPVMYLTALLPPQTVVAEVETGTFWYVAFVSSWRALLWKLVEFEGILCFDFEVPSVRELTLTSIDAFLVYNHASRLVMHLDRTAVEIRLGEAFTLLGYCCQRTLHRVKADTLRSIRNEVKAPKTPNATQAILVRDIIVHLGYGATPGGQLVMAHAQAMYARRVEARRKAKEARETAKENANSDDERSDSDEDLEDDAPVEHTAAMDMVGAIAPRELGFLLGDVAAGMALNEEEEDPVEAFDDAKAPERKPTPRGKPRTERVAGSSAERNAPRGRQRSPSPPTPPGIDDPIFGGEEPSPNDAVAADAAPPVTPAMQEDEQSEVEPQKVPDGELDAFPGRVGALFRLPADEILPAPQGCRFRRYGDTYKANLPAGVTFKDRNSRARTFGNKRPQAVAYQLVKAWLDGAVAAGLVHDWA